MTTKQKAVIFDIDGVLARIGKNEDGSPKRDYRDYDKVDSDEVIEGGALLFQNIYQHFQDFKKYAFLLNESYSIIVITERKELCRKKTTEFLFRITGVYSVTKTDTGFHTDINPEVYQLFMRPNDDHRPAHILKKEIYETHIKGNYDVVMAFDDDPEVCKI